MDGRGCKERKFVVRHRRMLLYLFSETRRCGIEGIPPTVLFSAGTLTCIGRVPGRVLRVTKWHAGRIALKDYRTVLHRASAFLNRITSGTYL